MPLHNLNVGDSFTISETTDVGGIANTNLNGTYTVATIVDDNKLNTFVKIMLDKGQIILVKDLDLEQVIGCAIFGKTEYWFSKSECIHLHTIFVKKNFRSFKLVSTLVDAVKKASENLPIYLAVTSGLSVDPVFKKLGFQNLGANWRMN